MRSSVLDTQTAKCEMKIECRNQPTNCSSEDSVASQILALMAFSLQNMSMDTELVLIECWMQKKWTNVLDPDDVISTVSNWGSINCKSQNEDASDGSWARGTQFPLGSSKAAWRMKGRWRVKRCNDFDKQNIRLHLKYTSARSPKTAEEGRLQQLALRQYRHPSGMRGF